MKILVLTILYWANIGFGSVSWYLYIVYIVVNKRNDQKGFVCACLAVHFGIWTLFDVLDGGTADTLLDAMVAAYFIYQWWKNRKNGRMKKALKELGMKSKARIQKLVENMTPSPIPSPSKV